MPLPFTSKTFGTSISRPAMSMRNLPGTSKASAMLPLPVNAWMAVSTSMVTSKVPSSPVTSAFTLPKSRPALFAPMPILSTSLPPLNSVFTSEMDGPSRVSGPTGAVLLDGAVAPLCTVLETVNTPDEATLATALAPVPTVQLPATTCTVTSPLVNICAGSTPVFGCRKNR